jgi:lipopolysaccharide biosynthesis glycosyltransferase
MSNTGEASQSRIAIVMAFDSRMFEHAQRCIETIQANCRHSFDLCILTIDLEQSELDWLIAQGARLFRDYAALPHFSDAPPHAAAMTCRPYIPQIFAGYDAYLWIDADIRVLDPSAFDFYIKLACFPPPTIAICQEVDPAYANVWNPKIAQAYQDGKDARLRRAFGSAAAQRLRCTFHFNAGIFAMHRQSPVWESYRRNLEMVMKMPYDRMAEQDAMNLALYEDIQHVRAGPSIMNWICAFSLPVRRTRDKRLMQPLYPHLPLAVLHMTNLFDETEVDGQKMTQLELYRRSNLPL